MRERGFAMLLVFVMAAAVAITLYLELPRFVFEAQRQKEGLLIERGEQYQRAIQVYVRKMKKYPQTIEELEDTNSLRFLRKRYADPFTGKDDWRLVHVGPNGMLTDSKVQKPQQQGKQGEQQASVNTFTSEGPAFGSTTTQTGQTAPGLARRPSDRPGAPGMPSVGQAGGEVPQQDPNQPAGVPAGVMGFIPAAPGQPGYSPGPTPYIPGQPGAYTPGSSTPVAYMPGGYTPGGSMPGQPGYTPGTVPTGYPQPGYQPGFFPMGQTGQPGQPGYSPGQPYPQGIPGLPGPFGRPGGSTYPTTASSSQQGGGLPGSFQPGSYPPGAYLPGGFTPGSMTQAGGTGLQAPPGSPPGGPNAALQMIQNLLTTPRPGGMPGGMAMGGQTLGTGMAGVASKFEGDTIKVYNERSKIDEWEFIYDPAKDKAGKTAGGMMQQGMQTGQSGQQGQGGIGSSSGFGSSSGAGSGTTGTSFGGSGFGGSTGFGSGSSGFGSGSSQPMQPMPSPMQRPPR